MAERRRIAILGGGAAGLTAAFELTATPELRERNEVTVLQLGWRLGGKGASGRRREVAERIEEHGLHVWFGFYENAFAVMKRCYEELGRPPGSPLRTWRDAFTPTDDVVIYSERDGEWAARRWSFPPRDGEPGEPAGEQSLDTLLRGTLGWLRAHRPGGAQGELPSEFDAALDALLDALETGGDVSEVVANVLGVEDLRDEAIATGLKTLSDLAESATDAGPFEEYREFAMAFDLFATIFRGIIADEIEEHGFARANGEEFVEWLRRHGAREETLAHGAMLRCFYQLCFAYADGNRGRPFLAAGKAAQAILRLAFTYRGSVMWKMEAGMGDAVFAPMFDVLRARGVAFRFFTAVTRLGVSEDGRLVDSIEVVPQVALRGETYEPLVDVGGLPCWPSAPRWEQLADGDALRERGVDFERDVNPLGREAETLVRGEHFDDAVLAIPVGAHRGLCDALAAANPRYAEMLDAAHTVATQALQVWLRAPAGELGWPHGDGKVTGAYVPPLDTYCDMTHLVPREAWEESDEVRHIAYFCGVMASREEDVETATDQARQDGLAHLREHIAALWPQFDFDRLVDPAGRAGEARIEAQYWRANVTGSDRYVLTPPGSVERRLRPDESGFENLVLAGDWTRNGICGGSVEAAVTSGRLAAQALTGEPRDVPGVSGWLEAD